jgi:hypothetical protein
MRLLAIACCTLAVAGMLSCGPGHKDETEAKAEFVTDVAPCPAIGGIDISPLEVSVGSELELRVRLIHGDGAKVSWRGAGGSFRRRESIRTFYRCERPGENPITVAVRRGSDCRKQERVTVTCTASAVPAGAGG